MAINYFEKPFFLAAVISALILYSPSFKKLQEKKLHSLIKIEDISKIQGKIKSSPVKNSSGSYSADFEVYYAKDNKNSWSEARGKIKIFIPCQMAEAYFPGKLYTASKNKNNYFFEKGENCIFEGYYKGGRFYIKNCSSCYFDNNLIGKINNIRSLCRLQFMRLMYGWREGGGFLLALLCGVREYTDDYCANAFRRAGLSHILALSGMHLSMFSSLAMFIGNRIKRKKVSTIIRIIAIFCFVWFAGFSPSLLRAFICCLLMIFSEIVGEQKLDMLLTLSFSFILQSIISPTDIYSTAFILSYAALAGILLCKKFFLILTSKFLPKIIASSFSSSLGAQVFTAPISLYMFNSFSPIGSIATLIISPMVTVFIYSGLLLIVLCLIFPVLQIPCGFFINFLYNIIKYSSGFFSKCPVISF